MLAFNSSDFEVFGIRVVPTVLNSFDLVDARESIDLNVEPERLGTLICLVAGVSVDINLKGNARILAHPVETFCEESPLKDNDQQARLRDIRFLNLL